MKTTCSNCGHIQESDMQRNGGKARWKGVSKAERSEILRRIAKAAWAKRKSNDKNQAREPSVPNTAETP